MIKQIKICNLHKLPNENVDFYHPLPSLIDYLIAIESEGDMWPDSHCVVRCLIALFRDSNGQVKFVRAWHK